MSSKEDTNLLINMIKKWREYNLTLQFTDLIWIVLLWKRILVSVVQKMETVEMYKRRDIYLQKIEEGQKYTPWSHMAWKACKQYRRPDIGITALRKSEAGNHYRKRILIRENVVIYEKSMGNRRTRITKGTNGYRDAKSIKGI